jgi:hypothetical protein
MEAIFSLKTFDANYEVTGRSVDGMVSEINRLIGTEQLVMQSIHVAPAGPDFRVLFSVNCESQEEKEFSLRLHESNVFASVTSLGVTEHE